ncbi:MAG: SDR family NAD(P)-dependent oxidoreductase [Firmicutes bacterium]|nr:SDR family NAD(P)-dependent oxidoreductase [Bacillota bacterium]
MQARRWTAEDIPDQRGRVVVITGGNRGLGLATAKALAAKNATVVLASRDVRRAERARQEILAAVPSASVTVMELDLASLAAVRRFAEQFREAFPRLDILINNAGVMGWPRTETADGFEAHFGINHLGHFALTGLLLGRLLDTPKSRVVTVSSQMEAAANLRFDDLMGERRYNPMIAYSRSKLCNLLFAYELERRLRRIGSETISVAAHPGTAATAILDSLRAPGASLAMRLLAWAADVFAQPPEMAALPQLFAATAPHVRGGEYYGPGGFFNMRGYPRRARSSRRSYDEGMARKLWNVSAALTGVRFERLETPPPSGGGIPAGEEQPESGPGSANG